MPTNTHPLTAQLSLENFRELIQPHALSLDELVSILGDLKAMEKLAKEAKKYVRGLVDGRMRGGLSEYKGTHFEVTRTDRYRAGNLDKELIEEELGADWIHAHSHDGTNYTEIRCKRLAPAQTC